MELTGKCKDEFEKWYFKDFEFNEEITDFDRKITLSTFYTEKYSMKYGVLVDYFDSVGVYINSGKNLSNSIGDKYNYIIQCNSKVTYEECFLDTNEARTAAIEKANELRNEALNK